MDMITTSLLRAQSLLYAVLALLLAFLAKKADDWRTTQFDDDHEIVEKGNSAVAIRRAGLYLGGMIAMTGVLSGATRGLVGDLLGIAAFGAAAYAALFVARYLCHKLILRGIDDDSECLKGNAAVGVVQLGIFVATGILLNGALSGDDTDLWRGLRAFGVFFVLGQLVFLALALAFQRLTPLDDQAELRKGNRSVGLEFAGQFVAIAIILRAGLTGPSQGLRADVVAFLMSAVIGSIALLLFQQLARRAFLHKADINRCLSDDNVALAITLQALSIAFALVLAATVV
jgi:uncharacterized membrane protein YjfL (UPF0719 family)